MKHEENKKYFKLGLTGVLVFVVCILIYFILLRIEQVTAGLVTVTGIMKPFIYGAVFAYILAPLCNKLEKLLQRICPPLQTKSTAVSVLSIVISVLLETAAIFVLVMLVIPQVWDSIVSLSESIPGQLTTVQGRLHDLFEQEPILQNYWDELFTAASAYVENWLTDKLLPSVGTILNTLGSSVAMIFTTLKNLFLGLLISVYFLASRKKFAVQGKMLLNGIFPQQWAVHIEEEILYADKMFNGFLMGKLLDSVIIGMLCFIGSVILGFPSAALISVIVGVTNIIPFFGPFIGAIPCIILLLLENPIQALYFLIFVIVLQQFDGNVLGPKILGDSTGLSSFWVLFSILLFGDLWGIVGMIVGVPLFAVIYDIIRRLIYFGLGKHGKSDMVDDYHNTFYPPKQPKKPKHPKKTKSEKSGAEKTETEKTGAEK